MSERFQRHSRRRPRAAGARCRGASRPSWPRRATKCCARWRKSKTPAAAPSARRRKRAPTRSTASPRDLLPVADTLTRALAAAPRDSADEALRNLLDRRRTHRTGVDRRVRAPWPQARRRQGRDVRPQPPPSGGAGALGPARGTSLLEVHAARLRAGRPDLARGDGAGFRRGRRRAAAKRRHQGLSRR